MTTECVGVSTCPMPPLSHVKNKIDPESEVNRNTVVGNRFSPGPGKLTGLGEAASFISDINTYKETKGHLKVANSYEQ